MTSPVLAHVQRQLARLVGQWSGEEQIHPTPFDPYDGPATARAHNRLALNDTVVVQEYVQERAGQTPFTGHGIIRYDAPSRQYVMHWFDSSGMPPSEFRGSFDGDSLKLTMQMGPGSMRATWELRAPDRYEYTMTVSGDGAQWTLYMQGTYVRER